MKTLIVTLGLILSAYSATGVLSETLWQGNARVSHDLCRMFLCNNAPLVSRPREQVRGGTQENIQQAVATFRMVLQQDPQDPYRWADLGEAFLAAGQKANAHYCFGRVLALAPRSAFSLLRAANLYFQMGKNRDALAIGARILALIPDYDSIVFDEYEYYVGNVDELLRFGLPEDRRAAQSWLQFLVRAGRTDDAQCTWDWISTRDYADDALAGDYAAFLIQQRHSDEASSAWIHYLGGRAGDYGKTNYLFNADFETEPIPSPFDWATGKADGVEVTRDSKTARSGQYSLCIRFTGTRNLDFIAASQLAFVPPGHYRFHAFVRTEGLTTDQGIRFRITDPEKPGQLDQVFGQVANQVAGSNPWSEVSHDIVVPPTTTLLRIQVIRQPSLKFDNKIAGTAWIDDLKLERIPARRPSQ